MKKTNLHFLIVAVAFLICLTITGCDFLLSDDDSLPAEPHDHVRGDVVVENETTETCTEEGGYDEVVYCALCDYEFERTHRTVRTLSGHTYEERVCTRCGDVSEYSMGLNFQLDSDKEAYWIRGIGECTDKHIVIPPEYNSLPVYAIGYDAFRGSDIEGVSIPDTIEIIGADAFYNCDNIKTILIPGNVKSIGRTAFSDCDSLESVVAEYGVTTFEFGAFQHCDSLESVVLPNSVTEVAPAMFSGCSSLISINLSTQLDKIPAKMFEECVSLATVVIPDHVMNIERNAFYRCTSLVSVTLGRSVVKIERGAFEICPKIIEVANKSDLDISIGSSDFGEVALYAKDVHGGESLISRVGDYLFYTVDETNYLVSYLGKDKVISLPENFNGETYEIYKEAFARQNTIVMVTVPKSVTGIGDAAFALCDYLVSVTLEVEITNIGESAFEGFYEYPFVYIGESQIVNLDGYLFAKSKNGNNLLVGYIGDETELNLPESCNGENYHISSIAFRRCNLITSVVIPDAVESIGDSAFANCKSLKRVIIGDGVTNIYERAFYSCEAISELVIGKGVKKIYQAAFGYCSSLKTVYYTGSQAEWGRITIEAYSPDLKDAKKTYDYVLKDVN